MTTTPERPGPQAEIDHDGIEPAVYQRRWKILAVLCTSLIIVSSSSHRSTSDGYSLDGYSLVSRQRTDNSVRVRTPSFRYTLARWYSTVLVLT